VSLLLHYRVYTCRCNGITTRRRIGKLLLFVHSYIAIFLAREHTPKIKPLYNENVNEENYVRSSGMCVGDAAGAASVQIAE
jgi:hypothetical protein